MSFDINAPDGTVSHVSAPDPAGGPDITVRIGDFKLPPGETYHQLVRLSQWYQFTRPGTYRITGHLGPQRPGVNISVDNSFSLEIAPPDPDRLRAKCEHLLAKASEAAAGSWDAAIDLSLIRDPIAVPYLVYCVIND